MRYKNFYFILLSFVFLAFTQQVQATPILITYQGSMMVEGEAFTGTGSFKIAIVDDAGNTSWSNDSSSVGGSEPASAVDTEVADGVYTLFLGDTNMDAIDPAIFSTSSTLFLRIWFSDGTNGFSLMDPDIQINTGIYALNSDTLQGKTPADFISIDDQISTTQIATEAITTSLISDGAVTTEKSDFFSNSGATFTLGNGSSTTMSILADNGDASMPGIRFNPSSGKWEISHDGSTYSTISTSASAGDITAVTAGTGLSGGGITGDVSLALDQSIAANWTGIHTFTTDVNYTLSGTENVALTSDLAGTVDVISLIVTPSGTAGTTQGLMIQQADSANTNGLDVGINIDNADTNLALTSGIKVSSAAGGVSTAVDLSDSDIVTALALGTNDVTVGGVTIDSGEFAYLNSVSSNIQTQFDTLTTNVAAAGDITSVVAGAGLITGAVSGAATVDVGAGSGITVNANDVALGVFSGDWNQTGAFDLILNNAASELKILESAGATFYGIVDVGDLSADHTYTLPNVDGTVVTTGDTGSVSTTMIANGTITTTDISGTAAITDGQVSDTLTASDLVAAGSVVADSEVDNDITIASTSSVDVNATTASGSLIHAGVTLGNDADADAVGAIQIDATSANTADADDLYGLNIGPLLSADGTVNESALRIADGGWDNAMEFEGSAADGNETVFRVTNPTGDNIITIPNASGTLAFTTGSNVATATALAANGANCGAGNYPLGVDASGATESCTADDDTPDLDSEVPDDITLNTAAKTHIFTFGAANYLAIDAGTTAHTDTNYGVLDVSMSTLTPGTYAAMIGAKTNDGMADGGGGANALGIFMAANDADGDLFGINIVAKATANATTDSYSAGLKIENLENTANSMVDGISVVSTTADGITDAIDVSDAEIFNALNVGANPIVGSTISLNATTTLDINAPDNTTDAFRLREAGAGNYLRLSTANGVELLVLSNSSTNASILLDGTGTISPNNASTNDLGTTSREWRHLYLSDDSGLNLGLDQDALLAYDETTDDRVELTGTGASLYVEDKLSLGIDSGSTITIADDADGGNSADYTLTPGSSYVQIQCADPNGCDLTMSETGAKAGQIVTIINVGPNAINFADTSGVSETAGAFAEGNYDSIAFLYASDRWVETNRSNN